MKTHKKKIQARNQTKINLKSLINAKNLNKLELVAKLKEERSIVVIISRRNIKFTGHHKQQR